MHGLSQCLCSLADMHAWSECSVEIGVYSPCNCIVNPVFDQSGEMITLTLNKLMSVCMLVWGKDLHLNNSI